MKHIIKGLFSKMLSILGLTYKNKRCSFKGALQQIKKMEFNPATILDIGAAEGTFSTMCYDYFQDSKYVMIEPLTENVPFLDKVIKNIPNSEYILAVASSKSGEKIINVHDDFVGSSLYDEKESYIKTIQRTVPGVTLDEICKKYSLKGPYLIKIDVQGAELDVLSGAQNVLNEAEYIILEVSLFQFVINGPQFYDVIEFMKSHSFVAYDMFGYHYKPLDGAMAQIDIAFVKENSLFRKNHIYCGSDEQRKNLTKNILRMRKIKECIKT